MRNMDDCPSFANLKKFSPKKLATLLVKALRAQLEALKTVENYDKLLE